MLLEYEYIDKSRIVIAAFKLINDHNEEIYVNTYHNRDNILYKNFVFLNESIFYNFENDTKKIRILIYFRVTEFNAVVKAWYIPINSDSIIIKHYGN